ncbi:hypothetical protein D3C75_1049720 [compost metagenome]
MQHCLLVQLLDGLQRINGNLQTIRKQHTESRYVQCGRDPLASHITDHADHPLLINLMKNEEIPAKGSCRNIQLLQLCLVFQRKSYGMPVILQLHRPLHFLFALRDVPQHQLQRFFFLINYRHP